MDELVSLAMLGKAEECADEGASGELAPVLFRDVHERSRSEDLDVGDIRLVPTPCFFRHHAVQSLRWSHVVDVRCIMKGIEPVRLGKVGISQHGLDLVKECLVHAFSHAIVLRHVRGCHFVLDAFVLEVLLDCVGDVFAPSIGMEGYDAMVRFDFRALHECFEAIHDFGSELETIDENLPGLVVNPGNEVLVVFMRFGHVAAYIREDATEDDVGSRSGGLVDFRMGLLAL